MMLFQNKTKNEVQKYIISHTKKTQRINIQMWKQ